MPSSRCPKNSIAPALGVNRPVIRLNTVVLPAPFGPIKPKIPRSGIVKLTILQDLQAAKVFGNR